MKPTFLLFIALAYCALAKGQLKMNASKCNYDGKYLYITVEITNNDTFEKSIYLNSELDVVQMPYNPNGDELSKRLNSNIPNAFILCYVNDTLIKDFKFYTLDVPKFVSITIPSKTSVIREYRVSVIGQVTEKLLLEKSNLLEIEFYLVYKTNGRISHLKSSHKEVSYKN